MAFFSKWWKEQSQENKDRFKQLVEDKQFEFVHGGWSLNDELVSHYEDIITNMMKGHEFLKQEFEITPKIAWHLDQFGHSLNQAALFKQMGFDYFVFARAPYNLKQKLREEKKLEFEW